MSNLQNYNKKHLIFHKKTKKCLLLFTSLVFYQTLVFLICYFCNKIIQYNNIMAQETQRQEGMLQAPEQQNTQATEQGTEQKKPNQEVCF